MKNNTKKNSTTIKLLESKINKQNHYLLAVSGGLDSMVLLDILHKSEYKIIVAHANFQLRGEDSNNDEKCVELYCKNNDIPLYLKKMDTKLYMNKWKMGVQETARKLRYEWFYELQKKYKLHQIITAHHQDDNVETFFINLMRGSGIKGLTGIDSTKIVRPLLLVTKSEILAYANENNVPYCEDKSNAETVYLRNKIRLHIVPELEKINATASSKIASTVERLNEINILYEERIAQLKKKICTTLKHQTFINKILLKKLDYAPTLLYECIKSFGFNFDQVNQILQTDETRKIFYSSTSQLVIDKKVYILNALIENNNTKYYEIEEATSRIAAEGFDIIHSTKEFNSTIINDPSHAQLDFAMLSYPLIIRKYKQGDYFYPLGLNKKKKVHDILKNKKLTLYEKENTWIVCSNEHIVWVINHRIDHRFRIKNNTTQSTTLKFIINK